MALFRCGMGPVEPPIKIENVKELYMQVTNNTNRYTKNTPLITVINDTTLVSGAQLFSAGRSASGDPGITSSGTSVVPLYIKVVYQNNTSDEYGSFVGARLVTGSDTKVEEFINEPGYIINEDGSKTPIEEVTPIQIPYYPVINKTESAT